MKRSLLCLILGVFVSVAIVYTDVLWFSTFDHKLVSDGATPEDSRFRWVYAVQEYSLTRAVSSVAFDVEVTDTSGAWYDYAPGPYWSRVDGSPSAEDINGRTLFEEATGWPMRCLISTCSALTDEPTLRTWTVESGIRTNLPLRGNELPLVIPFKPIWPGLLVNTAFFGGLLYAGLLLFTHGRWVWRRRTGRCLRCGYPNADNTSDVCSECGTEVS